MSKATRQRFFVVLPILLLAILLAALLFSSAFSSPTGPRWIQFIFREVAAACRDAGTQWMVVACLVSYFVTFLVLEGRFGVFRLKSNAGAERQSRPPSLLPRHILGNSDVWLVAFVVLVLVRYAFDYANAARSLQVVVLLTGVVIGKGIALWVGWLPRRKSQVSGFKLAETGRESKVESRESVEAETRHLPPALSPIEAERGTINYQQSTIHKARTVLGILIFLLALSALWHPERGLEFFYRGQQRWTGPWDNPNLFGLLMGTGLVLAVGMVVLGVGCLVSGEGRDHRTSNVQRSTFKFARWVLLVVGLGAVLLCGIGLVKSYSRGAWLGTAVGLALLSFQVIRCQESGGVTCLVAIWVRRNFLWLSILAVALFVIGFWQLRHTELPLLRRVFSVGNVNDFSWRNRVAAWQGAGHMMWDKPLVGFGWSKAEKIYGNEYRAARLEESAAIQMNDYLMIGISAGVPALICLLIYILPTLCRVAHAANRSPFNQLSIFDQQHSITVGSGAVVLLVGFWFDGGLFKLATGVGFWVLLELARVTGSIDKHITVASGAEFADAKSRARLCAGQLVGGFASSRLKCARPSMALRLVAGSVTIVAAGLTALHLGLPQMKVSERTLRVAHKILISAQERRDFEFLSIQPIWTNQPMRLLLQHVHLANYNRTLVNWKLDDELYRHYVLSPEVIPMSAAIAFDNQLSIPSQISTDFGWRRLLWEYFYPRIRKEISIEVAAEMIVRRLQERLTIISEVEMGRTFRQSWKSQQVSKGEFEVCIVAALRSVGIPARLSSSGVAEYFNGERWVFAQPAR